MKGLLLELKGVSIAFDRTSPVVKNIDLAVMKNSFTALVGESGSGKTVTALSVCWLLEGVCVTGSIVWDGRTDLAAASEDELVKVRGKRIAYVFQDPSSALDPVLRVGEQIAEAYTVHFPGAVPKKKALEYLHFVNLKDPERIWSSYPHELSGGMKQRAVIAMALIAEPALMIADEPTTALDVSVQADILRLLKRIQKEKDLSILFITHDLDLAASCSDRIYVMEKGRIVERMENSGGIFSPQEPYTQKLFKRQLLRHEPKTLIGP